MIVVIGITAILLDHFFHASYVMYIPVVLDMTKTELGDWLCGFHISSTSTTANNSELYDVKLCQPYRTQRNAEDS